MLGGACGDQDFVCTVPEVSERDAHARSGDTKDNTHRGSPSRLWPFPPVSGTEVRHNVACYLCIKKHVSEGAGDKCQPDITKSLVFSDRQMITVLNSASQACAPPSRIRNEAASDADEYHRSRALRSDCYDTADFDIAGITERLRRKTKKRAPTQEMHLSASGEQSPLGRPRNADACARLRSPFDV